MPNWASYCYMLLIFLSGLTIAIPSSPGLTHGIPVCKCCSFYRLSAVDMGCTHLIPLITSDDTRKSLSTFSSFISDRKTVRWDRKEHDGLDPGPAKNSTSPNWVCEKRRKKEHDQVEDSCIESYQIFTPMCMTCGWCLNWSYCFQSLEWCFGFMGIIPIAGRK